MTEARTRVRILCVDDDPNVLQGLALHLRRRYDMVTAPSGPAALELLEKDRSPAVIMSDMRMPGMDGAAFLGKARQLVPDAVRILLTGDAELEAAIAAVNEGQIFRFLSKPCPSSMLLASVEAAVEHHRLITAERVLLEQTLHGSIKTLTDVLALTNPVLFGRATRLKRLVAELSAKLGMRERWQVEVAAMLSQLGSITLPEDTVEKIYYGQALSDAEEKMAANVPAVTEKLLANIPRLEVVRGILGSYAKAHKRPDPREDAERHLIHRGAQLLRIAADFDVLEAQGTSASLAIDTMRGREDRYDPEVLEALAHIRGAHDVTENVRELPLAALRAGMRIAEDVKMSNGTLLVARGYDVTESFVERAKNFRAGSVREPVRVVLREK